MIGLFNKLTAKKKRGDEPKAQATKVKELPLAGVMKVIDHFPIGDKVSFYPEYKEELALDTIVVGYLLNDRIINSQAELEVVEEAEQQRLIITGHGERFEIPQVTKFALLVPAESHEEDRLNFDDKLELRRTGLFRTGNSIMLISKTEGHKTPYVETQSHRTQQLHEGIYAGLRVAILNVQVQSFQMKERRRQQRVATALPVTLHAPTGDKRYPCTLLDFSEGGARIGFDPESKISVITQPGRTLILELPMPEFEQFYILQGSITKLGEENLVLQLDRIMKDGALRPLGMVDALAIKGTLLKHPDSSLAVD